MTYIETPTLGEFGNLKSSFGGKPGVEHGIMEEIHHH